MNTYITAFQKKVLEKTFRLDSRFGDLLVTSKLQTLLLSPENFNFKIHSSFNGNIAVFIPTSKLPPILLKLIECDFGLIWKELTPISENSTKILFEGVVEYEFNNLFRNGYKSFRYAHVFAGYDQFSLEKIERFSRSCEALDFIFVHDKDPLKFNIIYDKLKVYQHLTVFPLTSVEAFRKYINRKEKGFPESLIHKATNRPSNNLKLTPLMQKVLTTLATCGTLKKSASNVKEELDFLIERIKDPDAIGIYSLSEQKVSLFLDSPEAKIMEAEALADPMEFQRRVTGSFNFFKASATFVKVSIDALVIQIKYYDEDDRSLKEYVGIHIHDDCTDFVFSINLDDTENGESLLKALRDYLIFTKGALPRCIYLDGFTMKLLKKYPRIIDLFERNGVQLLPSPNPNNKSSLERCFLTIQQKQLIKSVNFIGPGIKAKKRMSHPSKMFRVILNHKRNALKKWELNRTYKYLVKVCHNEGYFGKDLCTPKDRLELIEANPICYIDLDRYLPLCYHLHEVTVVAGAIVVPIKQKLEIKSKSDEIRYRNIHTDKYENRGDEIMAKMNEERVDAYIDSDNPLLAHIYLKDTTEKVGVMRLTTRVPNNEFDRNEEDHSYVQTRNEESAKIKARKTKKREKYLKEVNNTIGFDIRDVTKQKRLEEDIKSKSVSSNIGLDMLDDEKKIFDADKSRRKRRLKYDDDDFDMEILDTF